MKLDLTPVREAAAEGVAARERLERAIREARRRGASPRAVAEAAGLAHETVPRLAG